MTREEMLSVDIKTVQPETLKDIGEVEYMETDNPLEKVEHLKKQLGNLYVHKRGQVIVFNEYTEGRSINDVFGVLIASS